ncbi:cytochrome c heme-lyase [[Emmonsia] crescens]|uniref:Holocytochrome c-type synthase n=1 Tax=[Emmonsia] crescens TaxID=73230 RepID=A0A2B7YW80_9EURO|nr:cytochrome c heme-lyase [Emmonsia crescens]
MGWFWASAPSPSGPSPPTNEYIPALQGAERFSRSDNPQPSDGCPIRTLPGQNKNDTKQPLPSPPSCPVRSKDSPFHVPAPASSSLSSSPPTATTTASQPQSTLSKLNPLNYMFTSLSQSRAPNQTIDLPVEREISSIPRADSDGTSDKKWEYPSPQQMYNALLRKGYSDTPQDAIEAMVAVHNFLNEGAWEEIVGWERTFAGGLLKGWQRCKRGELNLWGEVYREDLERERRRERGNEALEAEAEAAEPRLVRFMGRPQERTPKASILQALGWVYPAKFGTSPPFDRHDWYVLRQTPSGPKEVRYVIDYYSGPPGPSGEPVFYLDIRPAVDTPTAAIERMMRWGGDVWWRASGGVARESKKQ